MPTLAVPLPRRPNIGRVPCVGCSRERCPRSHRDRQPQKGLLLAFAAGGMPGPAVPLPPSPVHQRAPVRRAAQGLPLPFHRDRHAPPPAVRTPSPPRRTRPARRHTPRHAPSRAPNTRRNRVRTPSLAVPPRCNFLVCQPGAARAPCLPFTRTRRMLRGDAKSALPWLSGAPSLLCAHPAPGHPSKRLDPPDPLDPGHFSIAFSVHYLGPVLARPRVQSFRLDPPEERCGNAGTTGACALTSPDWVQWVQWVFRLDPPRLDPAKVRNINAFSIEKMRVGPVVRETGPSAGEENPCWRGFRPRK
jgi:hypothetical protein